MDCFKKYYLDISSKNRNRNVCPKVSEFDVVLTSSGVFSIRSTNLYSR
jgi:phage antirepressor YoqD-like protein